MYVVDLTHEPIVWAERELPTNHSALQFMDALREAHRSAFANLTHCAERQVDPPPEGFRLDNYRFIYREMKDGGLMVPIKLREGENL